MITALAANAKILWGDPQKNRASAVLHKTDPDCPLRVFSSAVQLTPLGHSSSCTPQVTTADFQGPRNYVLPSCAAGKAPEPFLANILYTSIRSALASACEWLCVDLKHSAKQRCPMFTARGNWIART